LLIIVLIKGVPARTTKVVSVGGVLNRAEMDIVLNPHDSKAVEAADFVKRKVGGKTVALSMGPDQKLFPIMKPLYDAEVYGVDEEYVLSDRKMAGADTLATSYAVSLGVKKVVEVHMKAVEDLIKAVKKEGYSDALRSFARGLYEANLLPNKIYSELPAVRESIIERFLGGELTPSETVALLEDERTLLSKFIVFAGMKTTDGETGSVGPQVAEALSELLGKQLPHATYVEDFDIDPETLMVESERKMGYLSQKLEMELPALLTIEGEYRARETQASIQTAVRCNNYRGKIPQGIKWTADDLGADPKRLGLSGSPTIVGPGVEIGKPPVQKVLGKSLVFSRKTEAIQNEAKSYGPFDEGDLADGLPEVLLSRLQHDGVVVVFGYEVLKKELFGK
jgi:electron transfer flavoprotein beta subunit